MTQKVSSRSKLPSWATGFGAQVIAGLIIGLILGLIASGMNTCLLYTSPSPRD